jgi:hypothetical protein
MIQQVSIVYIKDDSIAPSEAQVPQKSTNINSICSVGWHISVTTTTTTKEITQR